MNKVMLGKYVNTHGIKGEIRIKSNFPYKSKVFKINNEIIINDVPYIIKSYRVHKDYDMITLDGINSINDIPFPKNTKVYSGWGGVLAALESRWVFLCFVILPILFIFLYELYEFAIEVKKNLKEA